MSDNQIAAGRIRNIRGQEVPVVAFYSVQGGVGKTTLARKFAELVTLAPGRDGYKPNVLLVDLDVETEGLTYRLAQRERAGFKTVHEIIAQRNVAVAQAMDMTVAVALASSAAQRGKLYLLPAAPPEAQGVFDTIAGIDKEELLELLTNTVQSLVKQYDISCVVIDCAPGSNPYSAAAATMADVPLLIGRNEPATYEKVRLLPERFREWYPQFQPARQRVIINAVSVREIYEQRAQEYAVFDFIPLTSDVIHETEGLPRTGSLRLLLLEKYLVDIIQGVLHGMNHLIPAAPDVLGPDWLDALKKLERAEEAPRLQRLHAFRYLWWVGIGLLVVGLALTGVHQIFDIGGGGLATVGILFAVVGLLLAAGGRYCEVQRRRTLLQVRALIDGGPDEVFRKLQEGASHRAELEEMKKLAATVAPQPSPR